MRIPEPLFLIVNFVVQLLLKSPLHFFMSSSVLLIHYVGRKSGAARSTPVRYIRADGIIRCFTSKEVQWWRNIQAMSVVSLLVQGSKKSYTARVLERDPAHYEQLLTEFLGMFPQDAVYQQIRLNTDGSLNDEDLASASHSTTIVVEFKET